MIDPAGRFHPLPGIGSGQATILFREKVFAMMKGRERISLGFTALLFAGEIYFIFIFIELQRFSGLFWD